MHAILIASKQQKQIASELSAMTSIPMLIPQESHFADTELRIMFDDPENLLVNSHAIIVHATSRPVHEHIMWLLLTCHALHQHNVKKISAIIPYFGYARQVMDPDGTRGGAQLVVNLLEMVGIQHIMSIELHVPRIVDLFSIPVIDIHLNAYIAHFLQRELAHAHYTVIAPDHGAIERASAIADLVRAPMMFFQKERYDINKTRITSYKGICDTEYAVIIDDIVDTGATMVHVAQELKKNRPACKIVAFAIHPVLSHGAAQSLQGSVLEKVWVTNSIQLADQQRFDKLQIVDISSELVKPVLDIAKGYHAAS